MACVDVPKPAVEPRPADEALRLREELPGESLGQPPLVTLGGPSAIDHEQPVELR
jgi:hypothetical protein